MYIIAGRGGVLNVFLGLFLLMILVGLRLLWWAFLILVGVIIYSYRAVKWWRHRNERQARTPLEPPAPVLSRAK